MLSSFLQTLTVPMTKSQRSFQGSILKTEVQEQALTSNATNFLLANKIQICPKFNIVDLNWIPYKSPKYSVKMPLTFGEHFQFASYFTIKTKNAVIKQKIFDWSIQIGHQRTAYKSASKDCPKLLSLKYAIAKIHSLY